MAIKLGRFGRIMFCFAACFAVTTVWAHKPGRFPQLERAIPQIVDGNRVINAETGKTLFITLSGNRPQATSLNRETVVKKWLAENYKLLGLSYAPDIHLVLRQETPGGEILRFLQSVNGIDAFLNDLVAAFTPEEYLQSVHLGLDDRLHVNTTTPAVTNSTAILTAYTTVKSLGVTGENDPPMVTLTVWCDDNGVTHLTQRVLVFPTNPYGEYEVLVDAQTGTALSIKDLTEYVDGTGNIFDPDPLTTAQVLYTVPGYGDNSGADSPQFDAQRHIRTLRDITENGGRDSLVGPWVQIRDFETPTVAPISTTNRDSFRFNRGQRAFDDVMVYAHIDSIQRYVQWLGYNNIQHLSMWADAHGLGTTYPDNDNSHYVPGTNRVAFGEGGVDDDQDADVIWHEYGHGIQNAIVPNFGSSNEEGSIGEGWGDYWAGSYSRSISTYYDTWVYNFDGHNTYWDGRVLNDPSTYPWSGQGEIHTNGQIWAHAMMDLDSLVGRTVANKLLIQGMYNIGLSATYVTYAHSILVADTTLYQGAHAMAIYTAFSARGILTMPPPTATISGGVYTATGNIPIPGIVVTLDNSVTRHDTTDSQGAYSFTSVSMGTHSLSVSDPAYNPVTANVQVTSSGTTTHNILLTRPVYQATSDSIHISLGANDTAYTFSPLTTLSNTGDGPGSYNLGLYTGPATQANWSLVREIDVGQITGDAALQGVEIYNGQIILSGANGSNNPNKFYRLDFNDGHLIGTVDQPSITVSGIRDLAALGDRLYGSENDSLWSWDTTLTNRQLVFRNTYISPLRALSAQWSATHTPVFYISDYAQPIRKLSSTGTLLATYTDAMHTSGIANGVNPTDPIWAVSTDTSRLWISTVNGTAVTRVQQLSLPTGFSSAGACWYEDPQSGITQLGVLLTATGSPVHAYLRFYTVSVPVAYATLQISATGTLSAGNNLNVPVHVSLDTNRTRFVFHLQQTAVPAITGLTMVVMERTTSVKAQAIDALPKTFTVSKSYPNPFNPLTEVEVAIPHSGTVQIRMYDVTGRLAIERSEVLSAGQHKLSFNFTGFSTGMYFGEFRFENKVVRQRLVYLK